MRAVVDIGSNSIKYAIDKDPQHPLKQIETRSWVTRLGKNLGAEKLLSLESLADSARALDEISLRFRELAIESQNIRVVATSAVRDCSNPETISGLVEKTLFCPLRVLSGDEEARYSMLGAAAASDDLLRGQPRLFVDVGGASTEVGVLEPQVMAHSFQAGAVRCHESLGLDQIPVSDDRWRVAQSELRSTFDTEWSRGLKSWGPDVKVTAVAVGGSLVVAAKAVDAKAIGDIGYLLQTATLKHFNDYLRSMTLKERLDIPRMDPKRADILVAGLLCLTTVLDIFSIDNVMITSWGLRHGILRTWR